MSHPALEARTSILGRIRSERIGSCCLLQGVINLRREQVIEARVSVVPIRKNHKEPDGSPFVDFVSFIVPKSSDRNPDLTFISAKAGQYHAESFSSVLLYQQLIIRSRYKATAVLVLNALTDKEDFVLTRRFAHGLISSFLEVRLTLV